MSDQSHLDERYFVHEIYVVPALREDRRESILKLKEELLGEKISPSKHADDEASI